MHARGGSQWQSRRKTSLGPLRRAHPASGATWNVQVVRGKMTSRCLWHACRALVLGMVLMFVGGAMATVGYYANNFPSLSDVRSNSTSTIRVKNEHRGLHLNNLSYVGPIIMGVGGFIVVASCVMTFEARDSAAKVVPARFKITGQGSARNPNSRNNTSRRSTGISNGPASLVLGSQNARWEQHLGVFRTSPATEQVPDRKALTAALVHFSKALGTPKTSPHRRPSESQSRRVSRSGSVPNLYAEKLSVPSVTSGSPANIRSETVGHRHHRGSRVSSMVQRSTRDTCGSSGGLLHPGMLQFHRHALSVDEPEPFARTLKQAGSHGSVQYGYGGEIVPVHKMRDRNKRSDTARRHVLSRQTKIEKDESLGSPKHGHISRRASTISNTSVSSKPHRSSRRASTISKTPSVDSRGAASTVDINSLDRSLLMGLTPPRKGVPSAAPGPISMPSGDKEYRSQLSICSEPVAISQRNLSCQSSLEPCVPEEESSPEQEHGQRDETGLVREEDRPSMPLEPLSVTNPPLRPDSLVLEPDSDERTAPNRFLYRSNSSKSFRKPKPKAASKKRSNEYDQIYVISSGNGGGGGGSGGSISGANGTTAPGSGRYPNFHHATMMARNNDDDHYDSIEVIHERRSKNFSKFSTSGGGGDGHDGRQDAVADSVDGEYRKMGSNTISVVADISPAPPIALAPELTADNDAPPGNEVLVGNGTPERTENACTQNIILNSQPPEGAERLEQSQYPATEDATPCQ
ncbi:AGAP005329-PA-like protein [Anopheles sinensis]|uniref:AGAP005329-PA-like protein n=1 Tax=Anopheles sinensis TaxID=74873 RepID=A0A084VAU2_ANOSI|nr:AGAP005329-PA-like protein [Anopheles sinensis]